jgi:hypothetical protein
MAKPLSSNYWTLSAWRDSDAIAGFIRQGPHRDAMHELSKVLPGFKTDRWTVTGHDLPPRWEDALTRTPSAHPNYAAAYGPESAPRARRAGAAAAREGKTRLQAAQP